MKDVIELTHLGNQNYKNEVSIIRRVTEEDYLKGEEEMKERRLLECGGAFAVELTIRKLYGNSGTFDDVCLILDNRYPNIDRDTAIMIAEQIKAKAEESNDKVLKLTPQRLIWVMRWAENKQFAVTKVNHQDIISEKTIRQLPEGLLSIKPYLNVAIEAGLVDENYQLLEENVNRNELAAMIWYINQCHKVKYIWKLFQNFWLLPSKKNSKVKVVNLQHYGKDISTPRIKDFINNVKDKNK